MSTQSNHRLVPMGAITTFRLVSLSERAVDAVIAWRNARLTETALRKLSDKELADVGLHRGEITELAEELARA